MKAARLFSILTIVFTVISLLGAFLAEWHFNFHPCKLCIYQRYLSLGMIVASSVALLYKRIWPSLIALSFAASLSIFQVAVEWRLVSYQSSCKANIGELIDLNAQGFYNAISKLDVVRCDQPQILLLNISFAEMTALALSCWLLIGILVLFYEKSKNRRNIAR